MSNKRPFEYKNTWVNGRQIHEHRYRAERALGRPLRTTEVVHHHGKIKDTRSQLVICQDHAYHMLLHRRMRVLRAGGNPNTDRICSGCKIPKPITAFGAWRQGLEGRNYYCRECWNRRSARIREAA